MDRLFTHTQFSSADASSLADGDSGQFNSNTEG